MRLLQIVPWHAYSDPPSQACARLVDRRAQRVVVHGARLVLLSLTDPGWPTGEFPTEHGTWRFVSYRELGRRLHGAFASGGSFAEQVVVHHATLMQQLSDLMDLVAESAPTTRWCCPPTCGSA